MNIDFWLYKIYVQLSGDVTAQSGKSADFWAAKIYYSIALGNNNAVPMGRSAEFYLGKFYFYLTGNPASTPYQRNINDWLRVIYLRMRYGTSQPLPTFANDRNAEFWARLLFELIESGNYYLRNPRVNNAVFSINESAIIGDFVGTVTGSDPDPGNDLTFTIVSGNTGNAFALNANTGALTVASALDYETTPSYSLVVRATDNGGLTGTGAITVNVTDVFDFLLNDNFTTSASAPLASPRNAEPTGTETLVQVDGEFSIANGKLVFPAQATPAWGDQGFYGAQLAQSIGLALYGRVRFTAVTDSNGSIIGWRSDTGASNTNILHGIRIGSSTLIAFLNASIVIGVGATAYVDYDFTVILNGSRSQLWSRGGGRSEWTLLYVGILSAGSLYPAFANYGLAGEMDAVRVTNELEAPFSIDYGIATSRVSGSVSVGQTFTHEANFDLEFTIGTLGDSRIYFRKQDANNYWLLETITDGRLRLSEVIAGVTSVRAVTTTGIIANGHRVFLTVDGNFFIAFSNDVQRWTYTSTTSNFYNATSGEVNSLGSTTISNLVTYPRRASSSAKTQLDLLLQGAARSDLLNDGFSSGTLVSPRTCDIAGRLLVADTTSKLAISNGQLVISGANATSDPRTMSEQSYTRATGIAFYGTLTINTYMGSNTMPLIGFGLSSSQRPIANSFYPRSSSVFSAQNNTSTFDLPDGALSTGVQYQTCIVLRTTGAFYLIKGGAYTNWTLVFVDHLNSTSTLFAGMGVNAASASGDIRIGEMKVAQLYGKWLSNVGIAQSYYGGSVSAGQAFTHDADFQMEWTQTTLPATTFQQDFREQDASNGWNVQISSTGAISLVEVVAGVPTTRGSAAGVVSATHKISVLTKGATITVDSNGVRRITYTSATNFQSATSGEVNALGGSTINDLAIFSRTVPSDAITELERVFL